MVKRTRNNNRSAYREMIYALNIYLACIARLLIPGLLMACFSGSLQGQEIDYRSQSLYIYKFTRYITWPAEKTGDAFLIGVLGSSPIIEELKLMASLKKASNEADIVVTEVNAADDLRIFNILYIPSSKSRQLGEILAKTGDNPVLIIAEREGMASKGATISFIVLENDLLKFEINMEKMAERKLEIADELLKLGFKL